MALSAASPLFKRVGPGQLYLAPAPTADPGTATPASTTDGYYGLFYTTPANKKALKAGTTPFVTLEKGGLDIKIKPSKVTFDPNNGPKMEIVTGLDEASAEITFFDLTPAKLVDMFGSQAADLITVAAASGVAGRQIALLGAQSYNTYYSLLYRIPSPTIPGEFWHYLLPAVTMFPDLDLKLSKSDEYKAKLTFQIQPSPYLLNSAGNGVCVITDDPTAAAL